ncbi:innexin-3 domain protein, partial [Ancylostoma duodenale]
MIDLLNGTTWQQSGVFPRVSLCDFDVRVMGNVQEHTVQCVLVINIFNEKIFIFLWFWYLMLMVFTLGSFLYWLFVAIVPYPNRRFIKRHLEISEMPFDPIESDKDVRRFIDCYLKSDGVFVIRMLTLQSGQFGGKPIECLVPDMFSSSWEQYAENYCWAQDTYYVPMGETVAGLADAERRQRRISYYQVILTHLLIGYEYSLIVFLV